MSIALPVYEPAPTFNAGTAVAGNFISRDKIHFLHSRHKSISLYESQAPGEIRKTQEFLVRGATGIYVIPARDSYELDSFVLVGDLISWGSQQGKGFDTIHDFIRLDSPDQLLRFCNTVPYTFARFDPLSLELVETRRSYFAEEKSPQILTHTFPNGNRFCIVGTSNGLMGAISLSANHSSDSYYKVRGKRDSFTFVSLSHDRIVVQATLHNDCCCLYFLLLTPDGGLSLEGTYVPEGVPSYLGPLPSPKRGVACLWFANRVEFIDPAADSKPALVGQAVLPVQMSSVHHAPELAEADAEIYVSTSYIARVLSSGAIEISQVSLDGARIGGGGLYSRGTDLVLLTKRHCSGQSVMTVRLTEQQPIRSSNTNSGINRVETNLCYEFSLISSGRCERFKRELSSWSHFFSPQSGSSFVTRKDDAAYAVCRRSGSYADLIGEVIELWMYKKTIVVTTENETKAFHYEGTPRLNLSPSNLFPGMHAARTFAFKDGIQVTGSHIINLNSGEQFEIPAKCTPVTDATCVNAHTVIIASGFSTFTVFGQNLRHEKEFDEPVIKVIAADGITATMTLQKLFIDFEKGSKCIEYDDRLSDAVISSGSYVVATFEGSVYCGSKYMGRVPVRNRPVRLIVANGKVLAVSDTDALIIDTVRKSSYGGASAFCGANAGFSWDCSSLAVLRNGSMWVCDLDKMDNDLGKSSQNFIGPLKTNVGGSPQWSWSEKLTHTNKITSVRFDHEVTDVCAVDDLQLEYLSGIKGVLEKIVPKVYISSFESLYLWADIGDSALFEQLMSVQKHLETAEHMIGGCNEPNSLGWRGFIDGETIRVALENPNVDWLFARAGLDADQLRLALRSIEF